MKTKNIIIPTLTTLFKSFQNGLRSVKSTTPRKYIEDLGLDYNDLEIGFNGGQFHHRKSDEFKKSCVELGVLTVSDAPVKEKGMIGYRNFGSYGIVFPLRDKTDEIVNYYVTRIKLDSNPTMYLNDKGIYPKYPSKLSKRLYIVPIVIDAASLLQAKVLGAREAVIALHDREILTQHIDGIGQLPDLEEIIIIDVEGTDLLTKVKEKFPRIDCKILPLPKEHNMNDMLQNYGSEGILEWMEESALPSTNKGGVTKAGLTIHNNQKISYKGEEANYEVVGQIPNDLGNMRISLHIIQPETGRKFRIKLDLYDYTNIQFHGNNLSEKEGFNYNRLEADMMSLTDLLESHRDKLFEKETTSLIGDEQVKELTPQAEQQAVKFLTEPNLLKRIDTTLGLSGIVGEEDNRLNMFILASTYKMLYPLHGLVQGTSGGGKTHLINAVAECMPQEDVISFTRATSKSFYYYTGDDLINKLLLIQDLDGLDDEAQYALREMQSAKTINSSVPITDRFGQRKTINKKVDTNFASFMATTKAEIYFDNMSRTIAVGIDESEEQTNRIIHYQNQKLAGIIDASQQLQAKQILRNCMRVLKSYEVVNPFADKIMLPLNAKMLRRLNNQFQHFVGQITLLNQYQRKIDKQGRLIVTKDDVKQAVEIFFNPILFKVDELDGSTRQFYERLKTYVKAQNNGSAHKFSQLEVRTQLNLGKTSVAKYIKTLHELEYVTIVSGSINKGFKYVINHWDNLSKMKEEIKKQMNNQLKTLGEH